MFRRIVIFLASLLFLLNSALVNASIGGWTLSNPTAVGASILYDGTKGSLTSSVLISPNASQVAKVLRGGIAGYALTFAVEQLLGAVDWVMDPANNQIVYNKKVTTDANSTSCSTAYKLLRPSDYKEYYYCSIEAFCAHWSILYPGDNIIITTDIDGLKGCLNKNWSVSPLKPVQNPHYDPKTLSLITVAQKVIENAESDNLDAQFAVLAAATNILSEAEQDDTKAKPIADELENNTDRDACEEQALADEIVCRSLPNQTNFQREIRNRCWASVQERYGACTKNRPLPPLVTW